MSSSYSEFRAPDITRCGYFLLLFGLVNTMILNLPRASKDRITLEQFGTCLNLNSLELIYDYGKSYSAKKL